MTPSAAAVDRPIETIVRSAPGSTVSVALDAHRFGMTFTSASTYRIPADGSLKLGMEMFWSAMPTGPPANGFQFARDTAVQPIRFRVTVSSGSQTATAEGTRFFVAGDVERRVADGNGLVATLFANRASGCHPGVVVLGGSEGGVPEEEAAVLASHDLTTLALAYYGAPGLSRSLTDVPIEIVRKGMDLLQHEPSVCQGGVSLLGGSKGAELALLAASTFPGVRSVVALKPASVVFSGLFGDSATVQSSWTYQSKPIPYANGAVPAPVATAVALKETKHERVSYAAQYLALVANNTDAAANIPVERIDAPLLLIAGGSDNLWPSEYMSRQIEERRAKMTQRYTDSVLIYPDAGHLIGLPYLFAKAELAHSFLDVGGTAAADEAADEALWPAVVSFLKPGVSALAGGGSCPPPIDSAHALVHAGHPAVSPDGRFIAFDSDRSGSDQVYVMPSEGGTERQLTTIAGDKGALQWLRDGSISFSVASGEGSILYAVDPSSGALRQLAVIGGRAARVSPDGHYVAYFTGSYVTARLIVAPLSGGSGRELTGDALAPVWSGWWAPDGSTLAFDARDGNTRNIYAARADGSGLRKITNFASAAGKPEWPAWTSDARALAIMASNPSGERHVSSIWRVNVADGSSVELTPHNCSYADETPAWFPDSKRIVFQSDRTGRFELWTIDADGSNERQLTQ